MGSLRSRGQRPVKRPDLKAFTVANELVLLPPGGEQVFALNESGAAIWQLCDGTRGLSDMLGALRSRYAGDDVEVLADVSDALLRLQSLGLVEVAPPPPGLDITTAVSIAPAVRERPRIRFVFGVEDRDYFRWQLAILLESMVGQLPNDWDVTIVVCNDHNALSPELAHLLKVYGVRWVTGLNHLHSHAIDFSSGTSGYVALNRVEALRAIAAQLEVDDVVCLMDTDLFLYGDLREELFPRGNAMASNWIVRGEPFMGFVGEGRGVDLQKLLGCIGYESPFKAGGVTVFLDGATVRNKKVIQDCFRFGQILYLLGKVSDLPDRATWVAEMACFAMAVTANGIEYEVLDIPQFAVQDPRQEDLPGGSFFHYYTDINDGGGGPFHQSEWHKQLFHERDFLLEDLDSFRASASSALEQRFLDLAVAARRRVYGTFAS